MRYGYWYVIDATGRKGWCLGAGNGVFVIPQSDEQRFHQPITVLSGPQANGRVTTMFNRSDRWP